MAFLDSLRAANIERDPSNDFWFDEAGNKATSGMRVTHESAMKQSAVYACITLIADSIASLPREIFEIKKNGKELVTAHPLVPVISYQPNAWMTGYEFWEFMTGCAAMRGAGYAEIVPGRRGAVDQLIPLHPSCVTVKQLDSGRLAYEFNHPTKNIKKIYTQDEIFCLRGFSLDGINGLSVISNFRNTIGLAQATEEHASRLFSNGAKPGGILTTDNTLKEETVASLRSSWRQTHEGVRNAGKTAIMHGGIKWQAIGMSSDDAQFIENRKFQIADIARIFRIPPHMIGDLEKSTFNNIEHQGLEFVKHAIRPWLERIEQAITRDLIAEPERYRVEFKVDALQRGDLKSRYEAYSTGINSGFITRNEARENDNRNPLPGLDEPLRPLNMDSDSKSKEQKSNSNKFIAAAVARLTNKEIKMVSGVLEKYTGEEKNAKLIYGYKQLTKDMTGQLLVSKDFAIKYCADALDELSTATEPEKKLSEWQNNKSDVLLEKVNQYHEI